MLSPPTIVEPVTPCLRRIRVRGQLPGARVTVTDDDDRGSIVAVGDAAETEDLVPLVAGLNLQAGHRLRAAQETVDDRSDPSPDSVTVLQPPTPADLELLYTPVPLLECGRCVWLDGAFPGAEVSLTVGHQPPISAEATRPSAKITLPAGAFGFDPTVRIVASQIACGLQGTEVRLSEPLPLSGLDWKGHAPTIEPPVKCQRAIKLGGLLPGAHVVIERSEHPGTVEACFALESGWFWFDTALEGEEKLSVHQELRDCELSGPIGEPAYATVADSVPPAPGLQGPICRGDREVTVTGTVAGAILEFFADGSPFCRAGAVGGNQRVAMPKLVSIARLTVRQTVCRGGGIVQSGESNAVRVRARTSAAASTTTSPRCWPPDPAKSPSVVEPVFDGGVAVGVADLVPGATARIISTARGGRIGEAAANGDHGVNVPLDLPLVMGDLLRLQVVNCGRAGSIAPFTRVQPRPDPTVPRLDDPSDDFGGVLLVRDAIAGAIVEVFNHGSNSGLPVPIGRIEANSSEVSVPTPPLLPGERVSARQRLPGSVSAMTPFVPLESKDADYEPGSTFRISHLIGDSDPTGKRPHPVNTVPLGVLRTDLGFAIEHKGVLWLFFGDSDETDETDADADPIAWVECEEPEDGPILHFVLDPETGAFRRLTVPELDDLENFEVPTGGFSYDGRLYLFVTKDKTTNLPRGFPKERMNRSKLVVGDDPHQDFHHLYDVSGSLRGDDWPAGPWLIQASPSVINNADWPDLPARSGDGLLIYGIGPYHDYLQSAVRLAWAPLTPGRPPPPPSDWKFLTDTTPQWQTAFELKQAAERGDPNARPRELVNEDREHLGELTVAWSETLRRWVMMYLTGIVRTARVPTGPWSKSKPQVVFAAGDPSRNADCREGGWCTYTYCPCLVSRWTRFDRSVRTATIYYNLSTIHEHYKPILMRSCLVGR